MVCSICLDIPQMPYVTPCGHIFCLECLISSSQKSPDATKAPCPTCRATFSLVSPTTAFIPEKYRQFIDSNLRRVYLDVSLETSLQEKVVKLESRVKSLEKDKSLLMSKCESHMAAAMSHAQKEKDARMRCTMLQKELSQANIRLAQLVEKETPSATRRSMASSHRFRHSLHTDALAPVPDSLLSRAGSQRVLGKRLDDASLALMTHISRPAVPLPKRRRVCRTSLGPRGE